MAVDEPGDASVPTLVMTGGPLDGTAYPLPQTGTNVVTTELSDWATNCPEYKVTAVQVAPTNE